MGRSSGPLRPQDGELRKYHQCLSENCQVRWGAEKYNAARGDVMPTHVPPSAWRPPPSSETAASANAADPGAPAAAVAAACAPPAPDEKTADPPTAPGAPATAVASGAGPTLWGSPPGTASAAPTGATEAALEGSLATGAGEGGRSPARKGDFDDGLFGDWPHDDVLRRTEEEETESGPGAPGGAGQATLSRYFSAAAVAVALGKPPEGADLKFRDAAAPLPEEENAPGGQQALSVTHEDMMPKGAEIVGETKAAQAQGAAVAAQQDQAERARHKLLRLSREIRKPNEYIGHSAFLLFALLKRVRPYCWEGKNRVDLLETYAPWALEYCTTAVAVDAVCVCPDKEKGWAPVDDAHPLATCRHFVGAAFIGSPLDAAATGLEQFYQPEGVVLLGTVVDGDCGIDVMCNMLHSEQSKEARRRLREDTDGGSNHFNGHPME